MSLNLSSDAFKNNRPIPPRYTKDGQNLSPALAWQGEPQQTASYAVIVEDPDAPRGVFTHWVCFNIPAQTHGLPTGVPKTDSIGETAVQGKNDFGSTGYDGAQPPPGKPHHYHFEVFALDTILPLRAGVTKRELQNAMQDHVLEKAELIGLYQQKAGG